MYQLKEQMGISICHESLISNCMAMSLQLLWSLETNCFEAPFFHLVILIPVYHKLEFSRRKSVNLVCLDDVPVMLPLDGNNVVVNVYSLCIPI